jgi:hypothetical protein
VQQFLSSLYSELSRCRAFWLLARFKLEFTLHAPLLVILATPRKIWNNQKRYCGGVNSEPEQRD